MKLGGYNSGESGRVVGVAGSMVDHVIYFYILIFTFIWKIKFYIQIYILINFPFISTNLSLKIILKKQYIDKGYVK